MILYNWLVRVCSWLCRPTGNSVTALEYKHVECQSRGYMKRYVHSMISPCKTWAICGYIYITHTRLPILLPRSDEATATELYNIEFSGYTPLV